MQGTGVEALSEIWERRFEEGGLGSSLGRVREMHCGTGFGVARGARWEEVCCERLGRGAGATFRWRMKRAGRRICSMGWILGCMNRPVNDLIIKLRLYDA